LPSFIGSWSDQHNLSTPIVKTIGLYGVRVLCCDCQDVRRRCGGRESGQNRKPLVEDVTMAWTTPTLVEICIGLEINGYLPAEF
jgi:coenzyme PQQ precursor peptide PqqA